MNKNLLWPILIGFCILLHSCRVEDDLAQSYKEPQNKFAAFSKNGNAPVSYSKAFEYLYNRYYEIRDIPMKSQNKSGEPVPYTDFRFHSQIMEIENGDKTMIFPVINGNRVIAITAGLIDKEETYLKYYYVSQDYDQYDFAINAFQKLVDQYSNTTNRAIVGGGGGLGDGGDGDTHEIPNIDIQPPKGGGGMYFPLPGNPGACMACLPDDGLPSGDCPKFKACGSNGGGGTAGNNNTDPCTKIAEKQRNPKYAAKFNALNKEEVFNMDKERGYYEKQPPLGVNTEAGFVQIDGPPGTTGLDLPDDTTGISGLFHSHNNTDGSIKIFSPTDVRTFINTLIGNAGTYGGGYANAYSTVVTSQGSYTLKFTGKTHPGGIDYYTTKVWDEWYRDEMEKTQDSNGEFPQNKVEDVFNRFLKEIVNKSGLEIFKVTENTAVKMSYNTATKKTDLDPCP